jgi:hypothetical protein
MELAAHIQALVAAELATLEPNLQSWAREHIIAPRLERLAADPEGRASVPVWLVTDHTGVRDSSYRVVYDPARSAFGLECTLQSGVRWYMGPYQGGFADVVRAM